MELIAEFGVNWNTIADFQSMVVLCKDLGINIIKMQMFRKDQAPDEVKKMYIGRGRAKYFFKFAKGHGIDLFFTCMYPEAVDICENLGVKYHKVRYVDNKNLILYRKLKKLKQILFVSCDDLNDTIFYNLSRYQKRVKLLYCVPRYPVSIKDYLPLNLKFHGISDHTKDLELYRHALEWKMEYFEMHVCMNKKEAYEGEWSKTLLQLKEEM